MWAIRTRLRCLLTSITGLWPASVTVTISHSHRHGSIVLYYPYERSRRTIQRAQPIVASILHLRSAVYCINQGVTLSSKRKWQKQCIGPHSRPRRSVTPTLAGTTQPHRIDTRKKKPGSYSAMRTIVIEKPGLRRTRSSSPKRLLPIIKRVTNTRRDAVASNVQRPVHWAKPGPGLRCAL